MSEMIIQGALGIMLSICAIQDIIRKKIYIVSIVFGAIILSVCIPFCHNLSIPDRFFGISVGIIVIIISKITKGKIGMGDGLLLCVTGFGLGLWNNLELFAIALFLAAVVSIILLVLRLVDRKKSIPFVPFLMASYLLLLFISQ